jgi:hypothetical protein
VVTLVTIIACGEHGALSSRGSSREGPATRRTGNPAARALTGWPAPS